MEFKPPKSVSFTENPADNWTYFKQKFTIYLQATEKENKDDVIKIAMLLNCIGDEGLQVYNTFKQNENDKKSYASVVKQFDEYFSPRKNTVFNRFKFFKRVQEEGEFFDNFLTNLKMLARECEFGDQESSLIRDRVIIGIKDVAIQEHLLRDTELDLIKTVKICRAHEASKNQARELQESVTKTVNVVNVRHNKERFHCKKCGIEHKFRKCPAFGKRCMICSQIGHFAVGCFQRNKNEDQKNRRYSKNNNIQNRAVYEVERENAADNEDGESDDSCLHVGQILEIDEVKELQSKVKNWFHQINISNQEIYFKIDSGAEINVIPYEVVEKLNKVDKIVNRKSKIVAFGGSQIKVEGAIQLLCQPKNRSEVNIEFVVIKGVKPILGLSTCIKLDLIHQINNVVCVDEEKNRFISNNQDAFEGLGKLPYKYKICLQEGAVPVVKPVRRLPDVVKDKLKVVLGCLEEKKIIQKVTKPTDWVHDLVHRLAGKKIYTVLDMKDWFHQIVLEEESSYICTFNTLWGRYRYKRLPFGLASSPEICQRENVRIFGDIPGVSIYFDDLIIAAEDEKEHDNLVSMVLSRAMQNKVIFNAEKTQYKVNTVKYLGFVFTKEGVTPDARQVESISKLSTPKNKKAVQRFLGMLNFLHNFIPNMSTESYPLRQLLSKEGEFKWGEIQQLSFDKLKKLVIEAQMLTYFDNKKPITVQSDASLTGLGACLLQDGKPVAFASRNLSRTEQNYPIIE